MNVADLQVKVGFDGSEAEKGLRGLGDSAGKAGGFLSNAASSMAGFLGAGVVMPAVAGAASFVSDSIFGLSSKLEMAQNGFTNMLGSSDAAKAHLEELKAFAASSPFEFVDVQQASQKLLAMGISASDVVPTLSSVGNAVAAMGGGKEQIDRVTTAIGQMNAKGKVSAEEMGQLAESGLPAWDMLATSLGKSTAETQKLVSEGKVASSEFLTAFNTEVPKRFGDSMAQQAATLPGLMSTLKDTVSMGLAGMAGPLTESLKGALDTLNGSLGPLMAALGTSFGPLLGVIGELVGTLAAQLTPILTQLAPVIGQTATLLGEALGTALGTIVPVIGSLLNAAAPLLPMLAQLANVIVSALAPVLDALGNALTPVIGALVDGLTPVFSALMPIVPNLVNALMPLVGVVLELLVAFIPLIGPMIELATIGTTKLLPMLIPVIALVASFASELIGKLVPAVTLIVGWLSDFVGALADLDFGKAGEMLAGLWNTITEWIGNAVSELPGMVMDLATGLLSWLVDVVPEAVIWLGTLWWTVESWILDKIVKLPFMVLGFVAGFISWLVKVVPEAVIWLGKLWWTVESWIIEQALKIPGLIAGWVTGFLSFAVDLIASLPGRLLDIANTIKDWATNLPGKIVEWIGDIGGEMAKIGPKIVEGIWNGIKDMGQWIKDKIGDFAGGVVDAFKSGFGIFSPAREMLPVGNMISAGLALGISKGTPFITSAVDDAVRAATIPPTSVTGSFSSTFTGPALTAPTQTSVTVNVHGGDPDAVVRTIEKWVRRNGPLPVGA